MRRPRLTCAAVLCCSLALPVSAQTVSGTVKSGGPLTGVGVQAELDGRRLGVETVTDSAGRFAFQLPSGARAASDLVLVFEKSGFRSEHRVLRVETALDRPLEIALLPLTGEGAIPDDVRVLLDARRTQVGTGQLMFVPYTLPADASGGNAADLNRRLRTQLQRLILTHVQTAIHDVATPDVSLSALEVSAPDLERLSTYGAYVNALAMVSGEGIGVRAGQEQTVELTSYFVIIQRAAKFEPPVLTIGDKVPASSIGSMSLDQRMSKQWGRATVIALAVNDLKAAQSLSGADRSSALKRVQRYLIAERSNVGANEPIAAAKLAELLGRVTEELAK